MMHLQGTFTAMITPFRGDELDEEGLAQNIQNQIAAGVQGIILLGTTGEASTLTEEEQARVVQIGVREAKGKIQIGIGTGSNATKIAVAKTKKAKEMGADFALVVSPYYNKPSQEGIFLHYEALSRIGLPLVVYNIQGRTAVNIETSTLLRIAELPNVIGVKESSGNLGQVGDVISTVGKKHPSFSVLSGDDVTTLPMMALGAVGVVSVVSNLVPEKMVALVEAALQCRFIEARKIHEELLPLFKAAFLEVNPVPIKEAMNLCQMAAGGCRLPLCELRPENREKLKEVVRCLVGCVK